MKKKKTEKNKTKEKEAARVTQELKNKQNTHIDAIHFSVTLDFFKSLLCRSEHMVTKRGGLVFKISVNTVILSSDVANSRK